MASLALGVVGAAAGAAFAPVGASLATWALTGAGVGMMAGGYIEQGQAQDAVAQRNAQIAEQNAIQARETAEFNAELDLWEAQNAMQFAETNAAVYLANEQEQLEAASYNASLQERADKRRRSQARMKAFASGVTYEGSPLLIDAEDEYLQELNVSNILYQGNVAAARQRNFANMSLYQGELDAARYRQRAKLGMRSGDITATNYQQRAGLQRFSGSQAKRQGYTDAASTILMAGGKAYGMQNPPGGGQGTEVLIA